MHACNMEPLVHVRSALGRSPRWHAVWFMRLWPDATSSIPWRPPECGPDAWSQVLLCIDGRVCACAVTGLPEERFLPGAEDPASDEVPPRAFRLLLARPCWAWPRWRRWTWWCAAASGP